MVFMGNSEKLFVEIFGMLLFSSIFIILWVQRKILSARKPRAREDLRLSVWSPEHPLTIQDKSWQPMSLLNPLNLSHSPLFLHKVFGRITPVTS